MPSTPAAGNTDTAHFCTKVLQPVAEANRIADASLKDENQRPPDTIIMRLPFSVHSARDCCRISDSSAESSMRRLISSATCVFTDQAGPRHPWITEVTNAGNERTNRRVCVCVCVCVYRKVAANTIDQDAVLRFPSQTEINILCFSLSF